jgi:hypothetical protein
MCEKQVRYSHALVFVERKRFADVDNGPNASSQKAENEVYLTEQQSLACQAKVSTPKSEFHKFLRH